MPRLSRLNVPTPVPPGDTVPLVTRSELWMPAAASVCTVPPVMEEGPAGAVDVPPRVTVPLWNVSVPLAQSSDPPSVRPTPPSMTASSQMFSGALTTCGFDERFVIVAGPPTPVTRISEPVIVWAPAPASKITSEYASKAWSLTGARSPEPSKCRLSPFTGAAAGFQLAPVEKRWSPSVPVHVTVGPAAGDVPGRAITAVALKTSTRAANAPAAMRRPGHRAANCLQRDITTAPSGGPRSVERIGAGMSGLDPHPKP
jgi:hypothetical protein